MATLNRTKDDPWRLKTPPGSSDYTMHMGERDGKPVLVCTVGKTVLEYGARCVDDLHAMLKAAGGWVELGGADEQKPAKDGTVEAWGRSSSNPIGGWYGLKKGLRGTVRRVSPAAPGRARPVRARAQRQEQSHARQVSPADAETVAAKWIGLPEDPQGPCYRALGRGGSASSVLVTRALSYTIPPPSGAQTDLVNRLSSVLGAHAPSYTIPPLSGARTPRGNRFSNGSLLLGPL